MVFGTRIKRGLVVVLLLAVAACSGQDIGSSSVGSSKVSLATFSAQRIKADIAFLADDMLKGRDTGTDEYRIAANYVAAEYARLGLLPAGVAGSYFQEVPFQSATLDVANSSMSAVIAGEGLDFALGDDFYMGGSVHNPAGIVTGDVVFVGYGIYAPELGHDDLSNIDLSGKIALYFSGAPATFQTEIKAHHGSASTKAAQFIARGAIGLISVNTKAREKRRPFSRLKKSLGQPNFGWSMDEETISAQGLKATAHISHNTARQLFRTAETSFDAILEVAEVGIPVAQPLGAVVTLKRTSLLTEPVFSPNVLGVLEGSDPKLKNEYVVISAHLDHVGVSSDAKDGDTINNGALDNAAGVSVMMEVARAFVNAGVRPRRSLLFAAVAAEEKGLLGAEYFTYYPTVDMAHVVANVNLDMPILLYDFTDVVAFGAERSSLGPVTEKAAASIGVKLSPDPMPQEGIFTRSDHYRFVQKGVPSVFLVTGFAEDTEGKDGGKIFMDFLTHTYHGVQDDINQPINYQAGAKFAYINWLILNSVASTKARPTWNKGDFFGETFKR